MASEFDLPIGFSYSQEEEDEFALPKPAAKAKPAAPARAPEALGSTFEMETGTAPPAEPLPPKKVTNFKDLTKPDNIKVIRDYATARFGKAGEQNKGESDEDYVKRWMTSMRQVEWNTTLNAVPELNWIYNAKKDDVLKAAKAHELYETVPDWYETGGQPGIRPFAEATLSAISEPTNVLSFGIGAAARYKAARAGINAAIKTRVKAVAGAAAAESVIGAGESVVQQQREIELSKASDMDVLDNALEWGDITKEEYNKYKKEVESRTVSKGQAALAGAISSVFGGAEARAAFKKPKLGTKDELEQILKAKKVTPMPTDPATKKLTDDFDQELEDILTQFDIFEGRKTLDELSAPTDLTQAEIRKDINRKAIDVAKYVMLLDPSFRPKANQKVSDAVKDLFMSVDAINDVTLDAALKKAGITPAEFAQASRTTVADAASVMQGYSALARVLRRVAEIDPEAQKIIDQMYKRDNEASTALGHGVQAIRRLERESKALVVSSIATTVRNMMGTTIGMTFDGAAKLLEGSLYTVGKATKAASTGTYQRGDLSRGLQNTIKDAFGTLTYLTNAGITAEVVDKILIDNPRIQQQLFHALQETGEQDLSKVARMANTFNVAQDVLFRRAVFSASIEKQLRDVGMDMYEIIAKGQRIPSDVVKNAADDALKATFSYMPKPRKKGQVSVEAIAEDIANGFVRNLERFPGGSLLVTFPRFMTNAMAFQYRYSPIGAASGVSEMLSAAKKFAKDEEGADRLMRQGTQKMSRGMVGTAILYAAYKYRQENQDTEWYNVKGEDGSTVDVRAIFPIGPYLAVGDFIAKMKEGKESEAKVSEMLSAITGMKLPAGAQNTILDSIPELMAGAEGKEMDKFKVAVGKVIGDFMGRFIQPGQPIFAFFDMFDKEAQIARDPNVIEGDDLVSEAAMNRLKGKVPGFKEELPEAKRYLRAETPVRGGEFFNVLTGVRVQPVKNKLETEFASLSLDPYTIYGSTGDKVYDRAVIQNTYKFLEDVVIPYIDSDRYKKLSQEEKKIGLTEYMRIALGAGRDITQGEMTASDIERVNKMKFNKLPQVKRNAINKMFKRDTGQTIDEAKAYDRVDEYEARLQEVM